MTGPPHTDRLTTVMHPTHVLFSNAGRQERIKVCQNCVRMVFCFSKKKNEKANVRSISGFVVLVVVRRGWQATWIIDYPCASWNKKTRALNKSSEGQRQAG